MRSPGELPKDGKKVAETLGVKFYSGSKEEERPLSILLEGREEMVVDVLEQAVEEDIRTGRRRRRFRVRTEEGKCYVLKEQDGVWIVRRLADPGKVG